MSLLLPVSGRGEYVYAGRKAWNVGLCYSLPYSLEQGLNPELKVFSLMVSQHVPLTFLSCPQLIIRVAGIALRLHSRLLPTEPSLQGSAFFSVSSDTSQIILAYLYSTYIAP